MIYCRSSLVSLRLHYKGLAITFFLLNARNCGYAQMEDLGCAVVCARNCGYGRMEDLGCGYARMGRFGMRSITKSRLTKGHEI